MKRVPEDPAAPTGLGGCGGHLPGASAPGCSNAAPLGPARFGSEVISSGLDLPHGLSD